MTQRPANVLTLKELLAPTGRHGYAVGSFSPRYPRMIAPILRAAQALASPAIVQISHKDMTRCGVSVEPFAEAFYRLSEELEVTVPVTLHLDHTEDRAVIEEALAAGFTSVMIDASDLPLEENIAVTRAVADLAHACGVSVEGELGTLGAYGFSETEASESFLYTDAVDVARFVEESAVDALAVSVGTVHGVSADKPMTIDVERLKAIRAQTRIPLVLHGGSGVEAEMMHRALHITGGGVSKVNLATDLELAMLDALYSKERLVDKQIEALDDDALKRAQDAIEKVVREKISRVLLSEGKARHYQNEVQGNEAPNR
ncbi:class II fructose-1,6-bisphosphate aldolase [soil metagenome]